MLLFVVVDLVSSQTWLFKQTYNVADVRLMQLLDKAVLDLKTSFLLAPAKPIKAKSLI